MFRRSSVHYRFASVLLPAVLLWSWMACLLICDEITEHGKQVNTVSTLDAYGESVSKTSSSDSCKLTATPVTFPDRQTVGAPLTADIQISFASVQHPAFEPSLFKSDVSQNSPPSTAVPIFLRLHTFRI